MSRLSAIVTLHATGSTVADLAEFVADAASLALPDGVELLEGGDAHLAEDPHRLGPIAPGGAHGTLGAVRRWLDAARAAGVGDDAVIDGLAGVAVDLDVVALERGSCSDHVGVNPPALFVSVDRACVDHLAAENVTVVASRS